MIKSRFNTSGSSIRRMDNSALLLKVRRPDVSRCRVRLEQFNPELFPQNEMVRTLFSDDYPAFKEKNYVTQVQTDVNTLYDEVLLLDQEPGDPSGEYHLELELQYMYFPEMVRCKTPIKVRTRN